MNTLGNPLGLPTDQVQTSIIGAWRRVINVNVNIENDADVPGGTSTNIEITENLTQVDAEAAEGGRASGCAGSSGS